MFFLKSFCNVSQIDIVIGEPSFQAHVLPWDNLYFWYAVNTLQPFLSSTTRILPESVSIHAIAMQFKDLWKIRAPVGLCEGFLLNIFDNMIKVIILILTVVLIGAYVHTYILKQTSIQLFNGLI